MFNKKKILVRFLFISLSMIIFFGCQKIDSENEKIKNEKVLLKIEKKRQMEIFFIQILIKMQFI